MSDANDMLKMPIEKLQSFPKTKNKKDLCVCKETQTGSINAEITCTNDTSLIECDKDDNLKPVQKDVCYERHSRRKRSANRLFTFIPNNYVSPKPRRTRSTVNTCNLLLRIQLQYMLYTHYYMQVISYKYCM